jgi:hypothetical protein
MFIHYRTQGLIFKKEDRGETNQIRDYRKSNQEDPFKTEVGSRDFLSVRD